MGRSARVGISCVALAILACGVPVDLENEADALIAEIDAAHTDVGRMRTALDSALENSSIERAVELADREKLAEKFDEADTIVIDAQACAADLRTLVDNEWMSGADKVQGMLYRCRYLAQRVETLAAEPAMTLARWEAFEAPGGDKTALAAIAQAEAAQEALAELPELRRQVTVMQDRYAHKNDDLEARYTDLAGLLEPLETHVAGVRAQLELRGKDDFDPAALATDIDETEQLATAASFGDADLRERLASLPSSYALVVSGIERKPVYFVRMARWTWTSSTSGDGTETDLGWAPTTADVYHQAVENDGLIIESTGSDSSSGSSTEVVDWDMSFETWATTFERVDGVDSEATRAQIDMDTFYDLYILAKGLHETFPDAGVVLEEVHSEEADDEEIPLDVAMTTRFAIEQKFPGQYHDERAITPSLDGTPLSAVGNPDFGSWEGDVWTWTPSFLADYRKIGGYHSPIESQFLDGYTTAAHQGYQDWRHDTGWDEQYDERGRWRVYAFVGGYRAAARQGGHSLRGVGPDTRSRGLGGGK